MFISFLFLNNFYPFNLLLLLRYYLYYLFTLGFPIVDSFPKWCFFFHLEFFFESVTLFLNKSISDLCFSFMSCFIFSIPLAGFEIGYSLICLVGSSLLACFYLKVMMLFCLFPPPLPPIIASYGIRPLYFSVAYFYEKFVLFSWIFRMGWDSR